MRDFVIVDRSEINSEESSLSKFLRIWMNLQVETKIENFNPEIFFEIKWYV